MTLMRLVGWTSRHTSSLNRKCVSSIALNLDYEKSIPANGNATDKPLVILHGLFGSKRNWQSLQKAFLKDLDRPIYSLDLRNHGSSPHSPRMSYDLMAEDILHFCEQLSLKNVSLLGHSMGGKVAMAFSLAPYLSTTLLSNLIVVDIAPSKGVLSQEFKSYVTAMKRIDEAGVKSRKEAQDILLEYEPDPMVRAFLLTNLSAPQEDGTLKFRVPINVISESLGDIGSFPYSPGMTKWHGRTLFIKGKKSNYINRHNLPDAKELFPNMKLEELDTAHWVHAERPNEFRKLVVNFIQNR